MWQGEFGQASSKLYSPISMMGKATVIIQPTSPDIEVA